MPASLAARSIKSLAVLTTNGIVTFRDQLKLDEAEIEIEIIRNKNLNLSTDNSELEFRLRKVKAAWEAYQNTK
jgi:hypothetical protein